MAVASHMTSFEQLKCSYQSNYTMPKFCHDVGSWYYTQIGLHMELFSRRRVETVKAK